MSLACALPDGRQVAVAPSVADRVACGVVVLEGVTVGPGDEVQVALATLGDDLRHRLAGLQPAQIAGLTEARNLYKSFGMDPSRHRPSSEALLRRVLQGKGLYRISNVVDACNLASLTYLLPIGMYDLDRVEGDVVLRAGRAGEEYPGIRKAPVHLAGRLGLFDAVGPFGSPTSDSARTCTDTTTNTILAVIMATAAYDVAALAAHVTHFGETFTRHCGAHVTCGCVLAGASA